MANSLLKLRDYSVKVNEKTIINNLSLNLNENERYLLIGENGSGKSTLLKSVMFDDYKTKGDLLYKGKIINNTKTVERAKLGIFLSHQEITEIAGVQILDFLRYSYNAIHIKNQLDPWTFKEYFDVYANQVNLPEDYAYRGINEGFSGGEKKRFELLQILLLKPEFVMLDEIDSGLDYKTKKEIYSTLLNYQKDNNGTTLFLVSHDQDILRYYKPTKIFQLTSGKIDKLDENLLKKLLKELS